MAMFRIGVFADSHGNHNAIERALCAAGKLDAAIHLGDLCADAETITTLLGQETFCVRGNNDFFSDHETELMVELSGVKIFCTHGHRFALYRGNDLVDARARELNADIALYGHTHVSALENHGGLLMLNPGSIGEPRDGKGCSFAVIEIDNRRITPKIYKL